jgi:hypothetical protein
MSGSFKELEGPIPDFESPPVVACLVCCRRHSVGWVERRQGEGQQWPYEGMCAESAPSMTGEGRGHVGGEGNR